MHRDSAIVNKVAGECSGRPEARMRNDQINATTLAAT